MKSGFNARLSCFDFAGDVFADSPFCTERDQRYVRTFAVLGF
jgi:hypothetical protein